MKIPVTSNKLPAIPAGCHVGRCIGVVDLGIQPSQKFDPKPQIWLAFELPAERLQTKDGDMPRMISRRFTRSMHAKAKLRTLIEGWLGSFTNDAAAGAFELMDLLNRPCLVTVTNTTGADGNVYADLASVSPLMKSMDPDAYPRERPLMRYDLDAPDANALALFPEWLQTVIRDRIPPQKDTRARASAPDTSFNVEEFNDPIPFS